MTSIDGGLFAAAADTACRLPPATLLPCCPAAQVVLEGDLVNLGVTSPAAALALGLMYLQTNDAAVAAAFHLPGRSRQNCSMHVVFNARTDFYKLLSDLRLCHCCRHLLRPGLCAARAAHPACPDAVTGCAQLPRPRHVWQFKCMIASSGSE